MTFMNDAGGGHDEYRAIPLLLLLLMLKNKKISPCAYDLSVLERKGKLILPIIYGVEM